MPYIAVCRDRQGDEPGRLRQEYLQAHFKYIEMILDQILVAGPFGDQEPGDCNASVFIYSVETRAEAETLLHNDPYYQAGIYGETTVAPFHAAAGRWAGGTAWS
jgi:uncharacterized protein YciI